MSAFPDELSTTLATTLERAILKVAKSRFEKAAKNHHKKVAKGHYGTKNDLEKVVKETWEEKIWDALQEFRKLGRGELVDYEDELFMSLYLSWYQFAHVKLALYLLREYLKDPGKPIRIIDFGCGPLTTQLALAGYLAEHIRNGGKTIPTTQIIPFDTSKLMREIGKELWKTFGVEVKQSVNQNKTEAEALSKAYKRIKKNGIDPIGSLDEHEVSSGESAESFLIAIHAVYKGEEDVMIKSLKKIRRKYKPKKIILTCYGGYGEKKDVAVRVLEGLQLSGSIFEPAPIDEPEGILESSLEELHGWRMELAEKCDNPHLYLRRKPSDWPTSPCILGWPKNIFLPSDE